MKKLLFAALAVFALASCTKNEVASIGDTKEITYQVVLGSDNNPTKGSVDLMQDVKFVSSAYYLPNGSVWATAKDQAVPYIADAVIGYNEEEDAWTAEDQYYWPLKGSLTFMAWSDSTSTVDPEEYPEISFSRENGVQLENFSILNYPNKDMMIANIAADYTSEQGTVPMEFQHILTKLQFIVKAPVDDKTEVFLKSISFGDVIVAGNYKQKDNQWTYATPTETRGDISMFNGGTTGVNIQGSQKLTPNTGDYSLVIPQTFPDSAPATFVVKYTVTTKYAQEPVVEEIEKTIPMSTVYTQWKKSCCYVLEIELLKSTIKWKPTVTEWTYSV